MVKTIFKAQLRPLSHWVILSVMLILFTGCQAKESPLSQKTAAMVIVVQDHCYTYVHSLDRAGS
jgi:hypothetical protein